MNEFQRQLLSDRLNENLRSQESYRAGIAKLKHQLAVKEARLQELIIEHEKLQEGIDW